MLSHAEYYRDFAEQHKLLLDTPERDRVLVHFDLEHGNLRGAIEWAVTSGDSDLGLRLAAATAPYWHDRSFFTEGRARIDSVLRLPAEPSGHRARCFTAAAGLATWHGDQAASRRYARESLAVYRSLGDRHGEAATLTTMGWATIQEDAPAARRLLLKASSLFRDLGDDESLGEALRGLAAADLTIGEVSRAREALHDSLAAYERTNERQQREYTRGMLGWVQRISGDFDEARLSYRHMLQAAHRGGALVPVGIALDCFADLALAEGDALRSIRLAAAANALRGRIGGGVSGGIAGMEPILPRARTAVSDDAYLAAHDEGEAMDVDEAVKHAVEG
jgi:non-specific serine/threonine protein kinase